MLNTLWLIQLAPLAAFFLVFFTGRRMKALAPLFALGGAAVSLAGTLQLWRMAPEIRRGVEFRYLWLKTSSFKAVPFWGTAPDQLGDIFIGFLIDPLNLFVLTAVTVIGFFVQLYSVTYMALDRDKPRYFGFLSLFSFAMIGVVVSANLLQTFMFWELVGLASYLLIGFWFEKKSASDAARKAFVINRLADLGFLAGIIFLFLAYGTLQIRYLDLPALNATLPAWMMTAIGIMLFSGIAGKSAQFPFHVWLPDAMEGPTPVSALIHSATMVAAGVFLLARLFTIFMASPVVITLIILVGTLTALLSASMAMIQRDIKKILAYSTISQLGFMVMCMGTGGVVAGLYHFSTHAFFKSLLFLTAGSFIHRYGTNDIYEIGSKGGRRDTFLMCLLAFGLFSLVGIWPLSGFYSKEAVMHSLLKMHPINVVMGLWVTLFTAYYAFRVLFILCFSKIQAPAAVHAPKGFLLWAERIPLLSLAAGSLAVGYLGTHTMGDRLLIWLDRHAHSGLAAGPLLFLVIAAIVAGIAAAFYSNREAATLRMDSRNPFMRILAKKYYIDAIYEFGVQRVVLVLSQGLREIDIRFVNGILVNQTAFTMKRIGRLFSFIQNGILQNYFWYSQAALLLAVLYLIRVS